jgi:3-oxoadipate enol-lactonase
MSAHHAGPLDEPKEQSLPVEGGTLAYEVSGRGAPVLFVHSVIADRRMWDREFAQGIEGHRIIRFDLRGFGRSPPATSRFAYSADIDALLQHLGARKPLLVGSSMGGGLAIDYTLDHPDRVGGLFLLAPGLSGGLLPPFESEEKAAFEYDDQKSQEINRAWAGGDRAKAVELLRQLWCVALEGSTRRHFERMVEENAGEVFDNRSMKLAADVPPAQPRLGGIRVPTTVLVGDRDNPSSVPFAQRIAAAVPGARLVNIPGADHLINLSRPEAFDRELAVALRALG